VLNNERGVTLDLLVKVAAAAGVSLDRMAEEIYGREFERDAEMRKAVTAIRARREVWLAQEKAAKTAA
jgi:hypothetical protein